MNINYHIVLPLLALLLTGSSCKKPTETPEPESKPASFTARLDASAASPFKTNWAVGDAIVVYSVKDGTVSSETLRAASVASDGSAVFTSKGTITSDSDGYYAFVQGTGVKSCDPSSGWTMDSGISGSIRQMTVSKCVKGTTAFSFRNIFSFLKFDISDSSVGYVELTGNNDEIVNRDVLISASDYSVSESASPAFSGEKAARVAVNGTGTYYVSLIPGTVFTKGYTLTAFTTSGKTISKTTYSDNFSVGNGKVYSAGEFQPEVLSFTASFQDTSTPEFKSSWAEGDAIEVYCEKDGSPAVEVIKATNVSSDGSTASFVSNGTLPSEASGYYAMIPESGIAGYQAQNWSTANLDVTSIEKPSVTVASCSDGSVDFKFRNIFSLLSFSFDEPAISYVVLEGNNSEMVSKNMLISFAKQAVNGNSSPSFTSAKSLRKNVSGAGAYYIGLYPGLKFSSGYTLTAYNASGVVVGKSKNPSAVTVESGKVYNAATFVITKPSVLTKVFDENNIVLSLGVVSDIHINNAATNTNKWQSALQQLKSKASEKDSDGLDGVLAVGDLIDNPNTSYLSTFKSTYEKELAPTKVPLIYTIGNHDVPNYSWSSSVVSDAAYLRSNLGSDYFTFDQDAAMGSEYECRDCLVGNHHILSVSPNSIGPILYNSKAVAWLESRLKAITEEDPNQYVVIITHPMIYDTVYGSLLGAADGIWSSSSPYYWETSALTSTLAKYPQAVVFGGHLHFPLNDPRSVWQGDFTAFGCASVRYMAIENGGYEGMKGQTVMNDCDEFSQGNLLQFDASGNMRLYRMDFYHNAVIGEPIVTSYPSEDRSHLEKYSFTRRAIANGAPSLSTLSVAASSSNTVVTFAAGEDDEFVHHYVLTLKKGNAVAATKKILADFYKSAQTSGMKKEWTQSLGALADGSYEVSLIAYDSWDAASNTLTKSFTVASSENSLWTDDDAGSKAVPGGDGSVSSGWLSYASGTVSWTGNTSGKPRIASLTLPDGTAYSVTQLSVDDFKGSWTIKSSQWDGRGGYFARNASASTPVSIGAPYSSESLPYLGQTLVNNLGIRGMAANLIMDACVEIDYSGHSVQFGLFFDGRKAQLITEGALKNTYGAFLPEMSAGAWSSYEFGRVDIGSPDYEWLWLTVTVKDGSLSASYLPLKQRVSVTHSYSRDYILGVEVMNFKAEDATDDNLVRSTSAKNTESGAFQADWITIYQANYGGVTANGLTFTKD